MFESGDLDNNKDLRNHLNPRVKDGNVALDKWLVNFQSQFIYVPRPGVEEEVLLPPLATYVTKHNIMPLQSKSGFYPITLPYDVKGPLRVDVRLRYRNLPPYLLDFLGVGELKDRLVIIDMASGTGVVEVE